MKANIFASIFSFVISLFGMYGGDVYKNIKSIENIYINKTVKIEYINSELYVFPYIEKDNLYGFMVCRLMFQIDTNKKYYTDIGEMDFLSDIFYQSMFERNIKFGNNWTTADVAGVADLALVKANTASGNKRYLKVLVQQVDYFEKGDVRRRNVEDRSLGG